MIKVVAAVFSTFILLISFQNCQQPPHPDEINGNGVTASNVVSANKVDLGSESVNGVEFMVEDTKVLTKAGYSYQVKYNKVLAVDLDTGVMTESSDVDSSVNTYCLPANLKNELISILKSSQVCRGDSVLEDGKVCAQSIKLPYASVVTSKGSYDLGSASDACGSNLIDLCDGQSDTLKGFIAAVKSQYSGMSCN